MEQILPPSFRRNEPCRHLDLSFLASRTMRWSISIVCITLLVVLSLQQPLAKEHRTSAWENQFCPLTGPGGGFQGWKRMGPEPISCSSSKLDSKPIPIMVASDPLLLTSSTVRGIEMPQVGLTSWVCDPWTPSLGKSHACLWYCHLEIL